MLGHDNDEFEDVYYDYDSSDFLDLENNSKLSKLLNEKLTEIREKSLISFHDIGYIDCRMENARGGYFIISDDTLYILHHYWEKIDSEDFYASIATDYIYNKELITIEWRDYTNDGSIVTTISKEQLSGIESYKDNYLNNIYLNQNFNRHVEAIINKYGQDQHVTEIGFIVNEKGINNVLPYYCFNLLIGTMSFFINFYFEYEKTKIKDIAIRIGDYVSELNVNGTIQLKEYHQHEHKKFLVNQEQTEKINQHIKIVESMEAEQRKIEIEHKIEEQKRALEMNKEFESKRVTIIKKATQLTINAESLLLLRNFIIKHSDQYYLNPENHLMKYFQTDWEGDTNLAYLPANFSTSVAMLIKLIDKKGYLDNEDDTAKRNIVLIALQLASVKYYSDCFNGKHLFHVNMSELSLDESVARFVELHVNVMKSEDVLEFFYALIEQYKFDYSVALVSDFLRLKDMIQKSIEEYHLEKFENSLLEDNEGLSNNIEDLDEMSGQEFEVFIANLFARMGYVTEVTKASNDQGIDIIARGSGGSLGIQAKRYQLETGVSNKAIQEVVAGLTHYKLTKGIVITTSYYTNSAIDLAKTNGIILWDRSELEKQIKLFM